jgi:hypothetical protein
MIVGIDRAPERRSWEVRILDEQRRVIARPTPGTPCDLPLDEGVGVVLEARVDDDARQSADQLTVPLRAKLGAICPAYRLGRSVPGRGTYDLIVYVTDAEQTALPERPHPGEV